VAVRYLGFLLTFPSAYNYGEESVTHHIIYDTTYCFAWNNSQKFSDDSFTPDCVIRCHKNYESDSGFQLSFKAIFDVCGQQ